MLFPGCLTGLGWVLSLRSQRPRRLRVQAAKARRVEDVLAEEGVEEFEEDITKMSRSRLKELFGAKTTGRINLSLLIKNVVWQTLGKLRRGEREPFEGNIRSFWYSHIKPVLSRAGGLRADSDPYGVMIDVFVRFVLELDLMRYREFGFADERARDRRIGGKNGHVIVAAEKRGHMGVLEQLHHDYDVTVLALGGHPSLLSTEYFAGEMEGAGFEIGQAYPLLTIVDYDPAGWSIVETFLRQLEDLEFGEAVRTDLVLPGNMMEEQIKLSRYRLSQRKSERKKVEKWLAESGGIEGKAYGLEADAMETEQLRDVFGREVERYLKLGVEEVRRRRKKEELVEVLEKKILAKLATG